MTQSVRKKFISPPIWLVISSILGTLSFSALAQNDSLPALPTSLCDSCFIVENNVFCLQWNSDRSLKLITRNTPASLLAAENYEAYWSKTIFEVYDSNGKRLCRKTSLYRSKGDATMTLKLNAIKLVDSCYEVLSAPQVLGNFSHRSYDSSGRFLKQLESDETTITRLINQAIKSSKCYNDIE